MFSFERVVATVLAFDFTYLFQTPQHNISTTDWTQPSEGGSKGSSGMKLTPNIGKKPKQNDADIDRLLGIMTAEDLTTGARKNSPSDNLPANNASRGFGPTGPIRTTLDKKKKAQTPSRNDDGWGDLGDDDDNICKEGEESKGWDDHWDAGAFTSTKGNSSHYFEISNCCIVENFA